jgi:hypothetical protein
MIVRAQLIAAGLALIATGCAPGPRPGRPEAGPMQATGARLFVSPAGAVFRPAGAGERPIEAWFRAADADGDGALVLAELRADFARAFTAFDRDGDSEIEPDEVALYERDILPEMASHGGRGGAGMGRRPGGMGRPGGGRGRGGMRSGGGGRAAGLARMTGAARFGLLPIAHPIMDADTDFNRGVSRAEWDAAAGRRFVMLDSTRSGRLTLAELVARRMGAARESARRRPRRAGLD